MQSQSQDRIAQLAYQLWQERGCPQGSPEVDWERAVRMLETPAGTANEVLSAPSPVRTSATPQARDEAAAESGTPTAGTPFATDGAGAAAATGTTRPRGKGRSTLRRSAI